MTLTAIYRRGLLAWKQRFSHKTKSFIASKWLRSAKLLIADAEAMSPVPLDLLTRTTEPKPAPEPLPFADPADADGAH